ncbi:TetR family transcriptional regulator [Rhizobium sp. ERR 922]|uniref:TetR/AcrR family transcriptional regulator n=1 Tax=unclassified Rhizobium TaxID=2613769 RepID=UPI00119BB4ED|nr:MULTISPECIES: TetR/AcrR family transcriptional regulator [unclassified Rhizobium]TWB16504.1 TetR family transcriptional regulator [Rhizobium sp. ERR1071]TWB47949.1 TetR family transcriptional regulator [Rhizobium sp. ERR 922]TWB89558.1 TetR family transcriptional regulator [Rhizobium sp. ERR 942]
MSNQIKLRDRKKEMTRQAISNVATRLFVEHGFDKVSVADIAYEADVARKTVFNYFRRKEDLVFDREDEIRELVRQALADRGREPPVRAFQALMRDLEETQHPLFRITERPIQFWRMVAESPTLTAYARGLQVTLADDLSRMLSDAAGRPRSDADAHLAGAMLMATLVTAYGEALRVFREKGDPQAALLGVMERGFAGVDAALAGTPYV